MRIFNKPLLCQDYFKYKAVGCASTLFKINPPPHNTTRGNEYKGKWKESKTFTCWVLHLLWRRLRAGGSHWYKVWFYCIIVQDMEKHRGGSVSEKILLQHCDWSVDLKLWWKRAEPQRKCITFSTQHFQAFPKPFCCDVTKIHQEVRFDLCESEGYFQCGSPFLSSCVEHACPSLSDLPVTSHASLPHPRTREHLHSEENAETCRIFSFYSWSVSISPWE